MIPLELADKVLSTALRTGGDLAEIYVEDATSLHLELDESKLEKAVRGVDRGAGVRVFFGNLITYAYTDDLSEGSLLKAAQAAAAAGQGSAQPAKIDLTYHKSPLTYTIEKPFETMSIADKAAILAQMDQTGRAYSPLIKQVRARYVETVRRCWIYNSEGVYCDDDRQFAELMGFVTAQRGDVIQEAIEGFGGRIGLELFDKNDPIALTKRLAESAVNMLDAKPAPSGEMTVVMCNGWGGVLFHEACGHQMEADFITKGSSAYTGMVGQRVANDIITALDDGTIAGRRGSLAVDDDGTPAQRTVLIEKGILKEYMWDKVEARRAGRESSTGNGRRQSFRHMPMPRMTNTYIDAGPHDPEEIIHSTTNGLYVKSLGGGQADIAKGDFVFSVTEGYLIENGKLTTPVRGATIMGNGPKVLQEIDMVGTDVALDPGFGTCGKGQTAKTSVGQPTVRLPRVTVGGTDKPMRGGV